MEPEEAVLTALKVHEARRSAGRERLKDVLSTTEAIDTLSGAKEERTFQRQSKLQEQQDVAVSKRQAAQIAEQKRHNMADESLNREKLAEQKETNKALKSYREGLIEWRKISSQAAVDKNRSAESKDAWKEFRSLTTAIGRAATSKQAAVPLDLYDAWANMAVRLEGMGEKVQVTLPFTAAGKLWGSDTVELTPQEWLDVRKYQSLRPDVDNKKMIELIKRWRAQGGTNP